MAYKLPNDALDDNTIEIGKLSSSVSNALVPVGGIIMWSGSVAEAEALSNWAICDGQNGRPDLRDKFVQGVGSSAAGSTANVNDQGGANSYQLALNQMPQHKHDVSDSGHSHTITDPGHAHTWTRQDAVINAGYRPWPASNNDCNLFVAQTGSSTTGISIQNDGGTEVRVKNYALMYVIKF